VRRKDSGRILRNGGALYNSKSKMKVYFRDENSDSDMAGVALCSNHWADHEK
jgi:hypothetical protein